MNDELSKFHRKIDSDLNQVKNHSMCFLKHLFEHLSYISAIDFKVNIYSENFSVTRKVKITHINHSCSSYFERCEKTMLSLSMLGNILISSGCLLGCDQPGEYRLSWQESGDIAVQNKKKQKKSDKAVTS